MSVLVCSSPTLPQCSGEIRGFRETGGVVALFIFYVCTLLHPLADSKAQISSAALQTAPMQGKRVWGKDVKGVSSPPSLTGPRPTPLVQQAGACVFSPSLDWKPTPPALTSRSHSLPRVDGLSRPLSKPSPPAQVRHRPCSRCPGSRWSLLPKLGSSLHWAGAFLPKAQERAQRVLGKLYDSESGPHQTHSTLCEAKLPSASSARGRYSH